MGLFKRERNLRFDILSAQGKAGAAGSAAPAAEQALKEIAESPAAPAAAKHIASVAKSSTGAFPARRRPELFARFPVLAQLVVTLAFVRVGKNFVGFIDFFELVFGGFISWIDVGVILARKLSVCRFDLIRASGFGNAEDFIVVSKLDRHS